MHAAADGGQDQAAYEAHQVALHAAASTLWGPTDMDAKIDTFVGSVKNVAIAVGNTLIPIIKAVVDLGSGLGIDSFIAAAAVGGEGSVTGVALAAAVPQRRRRRYNLRPIIVISE